MTTWEIVDELLDDHGYYGGGQGASLHNTHGPPGVESRPFDEWLTAARNLIDWSVATSLHGRLLIVALSRLDPPLKQYLSRDGFLDALAAELKEPVGTLFLHRPSGLPASISPDPAPLHIDSPALDDRLGRRALARSLARRLDRIWIEYSGAREESSFILHLHGAWGAGKTSLLKLLRDEIQTPEGVGRPRSTARRPWNWPRRRGPGEDSGGGASAAQAGSRDSGWIVIDFNAWQHQQVDPPWWPLMNEVYRQARLQLQGNLGMGARALAIQVRENGWRLVTGKRDFGLFMLLLLMVCAAWVGVLTVVDFSTNLHPGTAVLAQLASSAGKALATLWGNTLALKGLLAGIAAVVSAGLVFSRSLLSGSARAAQAFVSQGADPMVEVCDHFHALVRAVDQPILILIDDLDRCQAGYVVKLLEGIQTLFNDRRVTYVLAADRRWLHSCFETVYSSFAESIREPGRPLGSLFIEKAVQLSVALPPLQPETQEEFLGYLLGGGEPDKQEDIKKADEEVRKAFMGKWEESEVIAEASRVEDDPIRRRLRRSVAVERLSDVSFETGTTYFLKPFAPLLEPNPRAMKRLVNAYALRRDLAILAGVDVLTDVQKRKQLALWTILSMRWPILEDYILRSLSEGAEEQSRDVRTLLASKAVRMVLDGEGVDAKLDLAAIEVLAGLKAFVAKASV